MRVVACVMLLSVVATSAASAEPFPPITSEEANEHLAAGLTEYNLGNWSEAIRHFEAGARVEDSNKFFWNLAQAHRLAGNLDKARWYYDRLVVRLDGVDGAEEVIEWSRKYIAEIDAKLAAEEAAASAAAPEPAREPATPVDEPSPSSFTTTRKIALATGAVGIVLFGVGGSFALHAGDLRADADALCPMTACDRAAEANALIERSDRSYRNAEIALAVGTGAAVVAAVLWFTGKPQKRSRGTITAVPHISPGSAGVDVLVRF